MWRRVQAEITPTLLFTGAIYNLNRTNQPIAINAFNNVLTNTRTVGGEVALSAISPRSGRSRSATAISTPM